MKFLHTADWHIGKRLHEYPLVKEQHDALAQIAQIAQKEQVDAVVVAGDLYRSEERRVGKECRL